MYGVIQICLSVSGLCVVVSLYVGVVRCVIRLKYILQEGFQDRLAGSASMDGFVAQLALFSSRLGRVGG